MSSPTSYTPTASTSDLSSSTNVKLLTKSHSLVVETHNHHSPTASNLWVANACVESILDRWDDWDEDETEVLDFACGSGLISQKLAPHCKSIVGIDNSQVMVDLYNASVTNNDIPPDEMIAVYKSELKDEDSELEGRLFDVVVCAQAYHHILDVHSLTLALTRRLKPGGILIVIDLDNQIGFGEALLEKSGSNSIRSTKELEYDEKEKVTGVFHKGGFSMEGMKEIFESTGRLEDVEVEVSHSIRMSKMATLKGKVWTGKADLEIRWLIATGIKKLTNFAI